MVLSCFDSTYGSKCMFFNSQFHLIEAHLYSGEAHTSRTDSKKDEINARISRTEGNLSIKIMFKAIACFLNCDLNDVNFETAIVWVVTSCCYVAITIRRRMLPLFQHRTG